MKRSKLSLVAMILGAIGVLIMSTAVLGSDVSGETAESVGTMIGLGIVMPSVITSIVGFILNVIGYFTKNRTMTLISAIFYTLGLILMPLWGFVVIPSMILQYIAFAKMKKTEPKVIYVEKQDNEKIK